MDAAVPNAPAAGAPKPAKLGPAMLALLINAVPLVGVLWFEWSAINVLVLYWLENLLIAICTCIRLVLHRRWTRKRGYWRSSNRLGIESNGTPVKTGLIGEYALASFGFTLAHGVFVGVIAIIVHQKYPDQAMWNLSLPQVAEGALVITAMLGIELAGDLARIRSASFAAMREYAQGRIGRIIVLHLAILGGMFAMAMTDSPMGILYVLIALKTLADLAAIAARGAPRVDDADTPPPAWALRMADKLGKDKGGGAGFLRQWQAERETARKEAIEDEEPMPQR